MSIIEDKKTKSPLTKAEIKKFQKLEEKAADNTEMKADYMDDFEYYFGNLAEDLCYAGDKEWARRIYKIVEEKLDRGQIDSYYYVKLAEDIVDNLDDREWAKKIYKKAEKQFNVSRSDLADSIIENLGDEEWAKKIRNG